jgi:diguanylate cyclase (GGDEF)-like protein/PAS domain S-box-containing protein
MNYPLLLNALVSLIVGVALVLVWRRNPQQTFTRYLGWSNLVQLLIPASYWLTLNGSPTLRLMGMVALPVVSAAYSSLMVLGASQLADRPVRNASMAVFLAVFLAINIGSQWQGDLRVAQTISASVGTALGLLCCYWLWYAGHRSRGPSRLTAILITALGLNQFTFALLGNDGVALQASMATLIRVALGLVLIYAALQRSAQETARLRERFERLTDRSHQGIIIRQADRIAYANPAALAIYGAGSKEDLSVVMVARSIPRPERESIGKLLQEIESGQRDDASYDALRYRKDGTPMWLRFHCFGTEWDGAPAMQVLIADDTERRQATQALLHQALHDELTGLPNRNALMQRLRERCKAPTDNPAPFVLMLLDIDRFKLFNEAHGHSVGDEVLKAFGSALRASVDPQHAVMRLGEDEFAILSADGHNSVSAVELATGVRHLLGKPLQVADEVFFLDASMGIALYPHSGQDAEALLRAANAAMHVAKRTPGTSYTLAEKEFERGSSNMLEQEQALRTGMERGEFHLAYQPKVDAHTGVLTSFEALARWNRPGFGAVSPLEFIAAAERTGLIAALGSTLLWQACAQIAQWQATYGTCVPVAVNVSPLQLLDPRFPQLVEQALQDHGVPPQWLTLEITESSAVQNLDQTVAQVEQLRTLGVFVAMDDFGTGFSSLNMLRTLRLHTIKIDRGLIDPLPAPESIAVVRAICQLAQALHLHVVAEGVETSAQAEAARDAGCGELQGYLYARPLSPQDAGQWLAQQPAHHQGST